MTNRKKSIVLAGYVVCLLIVVVLKFHGDAMAFRLHIQQNLDYYHTYHELSCNFIPFRTLSLYLTDLPNTIALRNLLGNILPWIPLGLLTRWRFPTAKRSHIFGGLALFCLTTELLQLVTFTGSFDVDDWILNMIACLAAVMIWEWVCVEK